MAGSTYGNNFTITTFGESHGTALGVVVDGVPAGLPLCEEDIQVFMDRRKPGSSAITTQRKEADEIKFLSGLFEGKTTGCPIAMMIENTSQRSHDYSQIADIYRPGHADYTFDKKYGFRDYRGGGRSSGRETVGRVAAGAIAVKLLKELGIEFTTYTKSIGNIEIQTFDRDELGKNITGMPDKNASEKAESYLMECIEKKDSAGGVIECCISGVMPGLGEPVFNKLDARLAQAIMSIGAVKAFEMGDGCAAAKANGSTNNDNFRVVDGKIVKATNHSGGVLGGISDGSDIVFRAHIKPTPSIFSPQETVNKSGEEIVCEIKGRHDPIVVPRAIVVVECMAALTLVDLLFDNMHSKMDYIRDLYKN